MPCKRIPFSLQKMPFYRAKGHLLQGRLAGMEEQEGLRRTTKARKSFVLHSSFFTQLLVNRARVDYRLRRIVTAEHYEKVAYHGGFTFLVKFNYVLGGELVERHFHH